MTGDPRTAHSGNDDRSGATLRAKCCQLRLLRRDECLTHLVARRGDGGEHVAGVSSREGRAVVEINPHA